LPTDLLIQRVHGEAVVPRRLLVNVDNLALAADLITLLPAGQGRTRGELEAQLEVLEGDQTNYRLKRGLAHLPVSDFSTFEAGSPPEPAALRQRVFALSAPSVLSPRQSLATLMAVTDTLSRELAHDIGAEQVRARLYADLPEAHVLTRIPYRYPVGVRTEPGCSEQL
jgi:uncharacterized protein